MHNLKHTHFLKAFLLLGGKYMWLFCLLLFFFDNCSKDTSDLSHGGGSCKVAKHSVYIYMQCPQMFLRVFANGTYLLKDFSLHG